MPHATRILLPKSSPDAKSQRAYEVCGLNQAYVLAGDRNSFPLTAKIGRQELIYGDERLIGAFDWNNVGRVFDAAKVRYEVPDFWVDLFVSRVVLINDNHFN